MEIKNCSIYPRYEESLPKISRIPEFALFMYHRHGKSNRVKCLPHSNGQALRILLLMMENGDIGDVMVTRIGTPCRSDWMVSRIKNCASYSGIGCGAASFR